MDPSQVRASLERGGFDQDATEGSNPTYWPLRDPSGAGRLGAALSVGVGRLEPGWLVASSQCDDVLLCFIVARELSLPVARIVESEGLIGFDQDPPPRSRLVYISRSSPDSSFLRAVVATAERAGSELVGVSVLVALREAARRVTGLRTDVLYRYEAKVAPRHKARTARGR